MVGCEKYKREENEEREHRTFNIEHRTSNVERRKKRDLTPLIEVDVSRYFSHQKIAVSLYSM